ncbi:Ig-like domain-containing protein, partial [Alloiococcus otitis]
MVGKNNFKLRREKMGNKFYRYSIKRLSIGVASVAVSAGFLFAGREAVNVKAAEVSDENQALSQELDPDQNPALSEGSGVEDQETWEIPSKFGTELPDLDEELLEGIDDDQELLQEVEGQSPEEAPEEAKGHEEESQDIETEDDSDHTPSQNELDQNELEETLTEDPDEDDPEEDQADQNDQEGQVDEAGQWEEDQTDQDDNREGQNREDLGQPDQEAVTRPDLDGDKTDESKPADHSGDSSEEGSVKPELSLRNYIDPEGKSLTEIITDGFVKATLDDQELDIVRQDGHLLLNQPLQTNGRLQLEAINAAGVTNRRDFDLKEDGTLNPIKLVENKLENGRLQDSTADSSSQYSNRAANPQPTAGTTRSANTLSRAANDNLSPQSGRDVSNEVIVEGNLQVPTDSYTVARFLGIPIKKTGNYIQPTSGDSIYFTLSVQVPETVTSGDYIDLHYAPEIAIGQVDVNARTGLSFRERRLHEQIYGTPRPTITDGNGDIIAYIEDDRENNIIRYTFTDYVDRKSNVRFSHTLNHWIDLGEAQNTGEYPLYYRIGDEVFREDTFIDYRQNVRRNGPASTSSVINWVDDKTNTFRATAYFNIDNNYIGTEGRVFYITATEGTEPGAPNAINMDSLDIRVYRVSDGRVLPESRAFDPVAVGAEDITDQVNVESYLTSDNATEDGDYWIDAPTNNSDTYIMVVHGTFDPDRLGPQGEFGMQVQSNDVDYETGQQAGHTSYLVYSVEALSGEGNNIIEGGGEDKEEEKGPLFEMTVEDTGYGTKFVESDRPGWTGIREVRPGQNGRVRVLYVHVNPDQIPGFTPDDFVNIRGQYYQEVSREVIQESEDQIVEYSLPRIVNSIRRPDGSIEFIYNDGHTFTVPPAPTPQTLVPVVETDRGQGPSNPSDDNIRSYLTDNYNGDTRLGTWVTIKNPTGNYTITGEPEFIESYRFIPDGANGERGKDGRSVTIDLVDGEVEGREGTWVFVYQLDLEGNQGELIDSEFIPDGQDGHKVVIENRTPQGFDVVILDGEGQELDRETVSHGAKGDPGEDGINPVILTARGQGPADPSYALEVINEPGKYNGPYVSGLWITIYSPIGRTSTGEPRYREDVRFIPDGQNGENGRDGLTPRVRLEDGSDALDNSGKWVIVEYPVIDPTTGELVVDPVNNEPVYSEIQREFIQDGEDGLTPRVTVESGFDSDGNAGSWIIVESPLTNPITGEVTYEETNRTFVKDGQDGDDGEDGADG